MAKAELVKALIRSHAEGDSDRFYAIAIQMAAQAARQGQGRFAQELRDLVDQARGREDRELTGQRTRPVAIVRPKGELAGLLAAGFPSAHLSEMALEPSVRKRIERVIEEYRGRVVLREHGLSPMRKLLLIGPPGTGKTMTAAVLASELGLPLFMIRLDGLITKYLGETAAKLRLIFDAIVETRAVYLFDEFDAVGSERAARNEVGEIRRVLNSFLLFLESDDSDSLVVAATNHEQLLDRALFRRFDAVIRYHLPSPEVAEKVLRARLAFMATGHVDWEKVRAASRELSHADLTRASEQAAKNAILAHRTELDTPEIVEALDERRRSRGGEA